MAALLTYQYVFYGMPHTHFLNKRYLHRYGRYCRDLKFKNYKNSLRQENRKGPVKWSGTNYSTWGHRSHKHGPPSSSSWGGDWLPHVDATLPAQLLAEAAAIGIAEAAIVISAVAIETSLGIVVPPEILICHKFRDI